MRVTKKIGQDQFLIVSPLRIHDTVKLCGFFYLCLY